MSQIGTLVHKEISTYKGKVVNDSKSAENNVDVRRRDLDFVVNDWVSIKM